MTIADADGRYLDSTSICLGSVAAISGFPR